MRLHRLSLRCYGNFADQDLVLDPAPGRINLVVAPNGAGKSVLRQAISELLFGIHPRTPMGFRYDYARMRLETEASFPDGQTARFIRRKGSANTLVDAAGRPVPPSLAARLPIEADRKRLERLFVLDSAQLRAGGRALLQTDGDLADALLSGAGELGSARSLAADLAARRDAAAPMRRSGNTPFYRALDAWAGAATVLASTVRPPAVIAEEERRRDTAAAARDAANADAKSAVASLARHARIRVTRRHLQALDEATAWLAAHPGAPVLPKETGPALAKSKLAADAAERDAETARQNHAILVDSLAGIKPDKAVLAEATTIERLVVQDAIAGQSHADIPKREVELADAQTAIGLLLNELSSLQPPDRAAAEIRPAADIAQARALIGRAAGLAANRTAAAADAARHVEELRAAEDELASLAPADATDALRAVLEEVTAAGDPARLAEVAAKAAATERDRLGRALAAVPGWHGDADQLAALPVPAEEAAARLDSIVSFAKTALATARERAAEELSARDGIAARLAMVTAGGALPDQASLARARAHRDRGWALLFTRLSGTPAAEAEQAYAPGHPIALAFERAIRDADAVADRRVDETQRLTMAAELGASLARADADLAAAAGRVTSTQAAWTAAQQAWDAAVAPAGLAPGATLAELRALLTARATVLAARAAVHGAEATAAALIARQEDFARRLEAVLGSPSRHTVQTSVSMARHRLTDADNVNASRNALARSVLASRRAAAKAAPALTAANDALVTWSAEWEAVLRRLGRPANEEPDATASVLDRLVALPAHVAAAETARTRLTEMRSQLERFAATSADVAARLAEPEQPDPATRVRCLASRLGDARKATGAHDAMARQADTARLNAAAADSAAEAARQSLRAAITAAGADTLAAAEDRAAAAAERARQEMARDAALHRLQEDGAGFDVAALRAEAEGASLEATTEAEAAATALADAARAAAQEAAAAVERAEGTLRTLVAGEAAAQAEASRQAAAASLSRVLDEVLVQHLATLMLDHALQAVETSSSTNQRLARIEQTFAQLTCGAYHRLSPAEEDKESEDHGRLVAHEAGGAETHIGRLSQGTRDQLYLALRLVAIGDHVQGAAPLPFVADDILQTFDDGRARSALDALVDLSRHVQVIVLTHHPHLEAVAHGLPIHVCRIDPFPGPEPVQ